MKEIYFVTVFYIPHELLFTDKLLKNTEKPDGWDSHLYKRIRCWGWFENKNDAERCIKENWTDIYEHGYYNLAMIETTEPGPCSVHNSSDWFKVEFVDGIKYNVEKIEKPRIFKSLIGFSYA